jgi:hypothetical protein
MLSYYANGFNVVYLLFCYIFEQDGYNSHYLLHVHSRRPWHGYVRYQALGKKWWQERYLGGRDVGANL